jgi:hypothetical protein
MRYCTVPWSLLHLFYRKGTDDASMLRNLTAVIANHWTLVARDYGPKPCRGLPAPTMRSRFFMPAIRPYETIGFLQ